MKRAFLLSGWILATITSLFAQPNERPWSWRLDAGNGLTARPKSGISTIEARNSLGILPVHSFPSRLSIGFGLMMEWSSSHLLSRSSEISALNLAMQGELVLPVSVSYAFGTEGQYLIGAGLQQQVLFFRQSIARTAEMQEWLKQGGLKEPFRAGVEGMVMIGFRPSIARLEAGKWMIYSKVILGREVRVWYDRWPVSLMLGVQRKLGK